MPGTWSRSYSTTPNYQLRHYANPPFGDGKGLFLECGCVWVCSLAWFNLRRKKKKIRHDSSLSNVGLSVRESELKPNVIERNHRVCLIRSNQCRCNSKKLFACDSPPPHPLAETGVHLKTGIHVSRRTSTRLGEALRASVGTRETAGGRPEHTQAHRSLSISHTKCLWRLKSHQRKIEALLTTAGDKASSILLTNNPSWCVLVLRRRRRRGGSIEEKKSWLQVLNP